MSHNQTIQVKKLMLIIFQEDDLEGHCTAIMNEWNKYHTNRDRESEDKSKFNVDICNLLSTYAGLFKFSTLLSHKGQLLHMFSRYLSIICFF